VYTPFKNKWLEKFSDDDLPDYGTVKKSSLHKINKALPLPSLADMGFKKSSLEFPARKIDDKLVKNYAKTRDYPYDDKTSRLGIHLRFGTISIRQLIRQVKELSAVYLQELIWREFFMYILENNPRVVEEAYDSKFSDIPWKNSEKDFELWCQGKTGVPLVDAGMRQLNQTGFMHNRIRMVCASFLTRNLLIDWRWGEAYFARKLLDYELANNNGGWQWAAGTGVDAQPYFRVFNPESQADKYDKDRKYIKDWIPEWGTKDYPEPIVDLKESRKNAIDTYKEVANKS
jgi:deoxyribodipyrimidine photo-lyase